MLTTFSKKENMCNLLKKKKKMHPKFLTLNWEITEHCSVWCFLTSHQVS